MEEVSGLTTEVKDNLLIWVWSAAQPRFYIPNSRFRQTSTILVQKLVLIHGLYTCCPQCHPKQNLDPRRLSLLQLQPKSMLLLPRHPSPCVSTCLLSVVDAEDRSHQPLCHHLSHHCHHRNLDCPQPHPHLLPLLLCCLLQRKTQKLRQLPTPSKLLYSREEDASKGESRA